MPSPRWWWAAGVMAIVVPLLLAGCTTPHDVPTVGAPPTSMASARLSRPTSSAPSPAAAPRAAVLRELAAFDSTNRQTIATTAEPGGRAFIDGLVAAGFRRADMQVTPDRTTIGAAVPSVQFSVLWRGACLIGQYGPEPGGYRGMTAEAISGRCLLGKTRTIDW